MPHCNSPPSSLVAGCPVSRCCQSRFASACVQTEANDNAGRKLVAAFAAFCVSALKLSQAAEIAASCVNHTIGHVVSEKI